MIKRRSNWYIYLITFLLAGIIVYIISSALLSSFYASHTSNSSTSSQQNGTAYKPDANSNFTVLAMLGKSADDAPDYYMTITYRGDLNSIIVMPYLSKTEFGGQTLKDEYIGGGAEAVLKSVSNAAGVEIKKYIRFNEANMVEFFNSVGNTTLSVPKELKYENKQDKTLTIVYAGTYSFTGSQLYAYLSFPDYKEKDVQYSCKVHALAISSFINQNFNNVSEKSLDSYADFITNFIDTNITAEDYANKKQALLYTFANTNDPCDYYIPYGEINGETFTVSEASLQTVKERIQGQ